MLFGVLAATLAIALVLRERRKRALTALSMQHRRLGPDGIAIGAESFVLARADGPAVLLLHGAGDTPQTLRLLGEYLHARGFHVVAPLLPGHGRDVGAFARITADELTVAARVAYEALVREREWVGVIGLSMGGALAVQIAADAPALPALGLAAPYLAMPTTITRAARIWWLWGLAAPLVKSGDGVSILDPVERERNLAYGVFTPNALRALYQTVRRAQAALPRVAAPTLVVQSRNDNRISVDAATSAFARLGAREKRLAWTADGAHVITVDYGRDEVFRQLATWMEIHGASQFIR
jgi:carboxylesterase